MTAIEESELIFTTKLGKKRDAFFSSSSLRAKGKDLLCVIIA